MTIRTIGISRSAALSALGLLIVSAFFIPRTQAFIGTFMATEVAPNVPTATVVFPELTGGAEAASAVAASTTVDTNIAIVADTAGAAGNALSIAVAQSDADLGSTTNATIDVAKSGSAITVTVVHNSNADADGAGNPIEVTRASVVSALGMAASGAAQGGLVSVTITNDVTADITASGGDATKVGTVGATTLTGGLDASGPAAAVSTSNSFAAVHANAGNLSLGIGGTAITLTPGDSAAQAATAAADAINGDGANPYSATVVNTDQLRLTTDATGSGTNGPVVASDLTYNMNTQVVDFTPSSPTVGETFRVYLNGTPYLYPVASDVNVQTVVEALEPLIEADGATTCTEDDTKITCTADAAGTGFSASAEVVDLTAPIIAEESPVPSAGNDTTPSFTFTTNEAGTIGYGGDCSSATSAAATSSNTVTFNALSEGTHSNCTITVTDLYGNTSNTLALDAFVIDTTAPTVSVSASPAGGNFNAGDVITLTLTWSEAVTSTDSLTVALNSGGSCTASAFTGATSGTCTYTVQAGENAANLSVNSITINNGGTMTDAASNAATLTPAGALASGILIDTVAPVITTASFSPTTGTLAIGGVLTLNIEADQSGYTQSAITINGVAASGFTDNGDTTYTAQYTVASGNQDIGASDRITLHIQLADAAGNSNEAFTTSPPFTITPAIDANAPAAPSTPDMASGDDSGSSSSDNITTDTTPTFSGTAEDGATITLLDGASVVGSTTASSGAWSITSSALSEGVHSISAYATDTAGNVGTASTGLNVTVDLTAPTVSETAAVANPTNDPTPAYSFTFNEAGTAGYGGSCASATTAVSAGATTIDFSTLGEGTYSDCTITATDTAGNVGNTINVTAFTVDLTAPTVAITSSTADGYYNAGDVIALTLTLSEAATSTDSLTVALNSGGSCTASAFTAATTSTCAYTVQAGENASDLTVSGITVNNGGTLRDAAGNDANLTPTLNLAATRELVVDTAEPTLTQLTAILSPSNDPTPTYRFSSDEAGTLVIGGGCAATTTTAAAGVNALTFTALTDGTYACPISVTDAAGNTSASINTPTTFTIDTAAPTVAITSSTGDGYYNAGDAITLTLTFNESAIFSTDNIAVTTDSGGSCTIPAVGGGNVFSCTYTVGAGENSSDLTVSGLAIDNGGRIFDSANNDANLTPTSNLAETSNLVVDTTAPVLTLAGSNPASTVHNQAYSDAGATANEGLTASVVTTNPVNTANVGTYTVTYNVDDLAGNAAAPITRTVYVVTDPGSSSMSVASTTNPDGTVSATVPADVTLGSGTLFVPAGTTFPGSSTWNGIVLAPASVATVTDPTELSGLSISSPSSIEAGSALSALTLNQPVRLFFPGKIGQRVGWSSGGVFTHITATCAGDSLAAVDAQLSVGGDCYLYADGGIAVWTEHLTIFTTFAATPNGTGTSGGGGGGNGPVASPSPSSNVGGEVLGAEDERSGYYFTRDLKPGISGEDVSALQMIMIDLGHMAGESTGYYGSKTAAAVKLYQKENGLPQVGVVGPMTRAALNENSSSTPRGTPALLQTQADAILGLLRSFGADQSIINSVQKALGY